MSRTIYSGTTENNINIDDMVDDYSDFVFKNDKLKNHFVRLSGARDSLEEVQKPALVVFSIDEPFVPIYAKVLNGTYSDYTDFFGYTEKFQKEVDLFWDEYLNYLSKHLRADKRKKKERRVTA